MFNTACDRHGQERGVGWVQGSMIVDAEGYPLAGPASRGGEQILLATLNLAEAQISASVHAMISGSAARVVMIGHELKR
jgi:predicted amidohydrolase